MFSPAKLLLPIALVIAFATPAYATKISAAANTRTMTGTEYVPYGVAGDNTAYSTLLSALPCGFTVAGGLSKTNCILGTTQPNRTNATTSDTILSTDGGSIVLETNGSAVSVGIASASSAGFTSNFSVEIDAQAAAVTVTPTGSTINGAGSFTIASGTGAYIYSDGTNYKVARNSTALLGSGTPGGSSGQLQYNSGGAFAGATIGTGLSFTGGTLSATGGGGGGSGSGTVLTGTANTLAAYPNAGAVISSSPIKYNSAGMLSGISYLSASGPLYVNAGTSTPSGDFQIGSTGANGMLRYTSSGSGFIGVYSSGNNLFYGISSSLPCPSGTSCLGGYYNGVGVGGSTYNTGNPIFGVLTSAAQVRFNVTDTGIVTTLNNTLDDASGNMAALHTIKTGGYTVSTLPSGTIGMRAYVTDQTTSCPAVGGALTGGGSVVCPVFYNNSAWVGG
jgi:hypothetical protein